MADQVIHLSDATDSGRHWRPEDMLAQAIEELKDDSAAKVAIVFGRPQDGQTDIEVWSAGMGVGQVTGPETVADIVQALAEGYAEAVEAQAKGSRYLG